MLHNVAILWDELLRAFTNMEQDKVYFLDKATGEIFFVKSDLDDQFWHHMEQLHERFIEIPGLDPATERRLISDFINQNDNAELRRLIKQSLSSRPPYANPTDIISFFPDEEDKLSEMKDSFVSERVKNWLEQHNLLSTSTSLNGIN